jgi:hypothetical protein
VAFAAAILGFRYRQHGRIECNKAQHGKNYTREKCKNPFFHNLKRLGTELIYSIFGYYKECNIFLAPVEKSVQAYEIIYVMENNWISAIISGP